jgi:predicted ester cyclase
MMNAPGQTIPATGRRVNIPFVVVTSFDGGGITRFTLHFDRAELLGQLGVLSAFG